MRGITWDHPRAYEPLAAFAATHPDVAAVQWDRQSLAGFEAHPIAELARTYDLLIVDHPGLGAATQASALLPLEDLFDADELHHWQAASVGRTWSSYHYRDRQWAVPIDAATQVGVYRPDLITAVPRHWVDVLDTVKAAPSALCLAGPHALLMLLGASGSSDAAGAGELLPPAAGEILALLQQIWPLVDHEVSLRDPIGVHEALAAGAVAYCPLAYGYARYAHPADGTHALAWADAPAWTDTPGSTLGGTGLAVSAYASDLDVVRRYVRAFLVDEVQNRLVPEHGGQPATTAAWHAADIDAEWGHYYSSTVRSVETAVIRPRFSGWIAFQDEASDLVRAAITTGDDPAATVDEINQRYQEVRP